MSRVILAGMAATLWHELEVAGSAGCTAEHLAAAWYVDRPRPKEVGASVRGGLAKVRLAAPRVGLELHSVRGSEGTLYMLLPTGAATPAEPIISLAKRVPTAKPAPVDLPAIDVPDLRSLTAIEWTGSAAAMLQLSEGRQARCAYPNDRAPKDPDYRVCAVVIEDPRKPNGNPQPYCLKCRELAYTKASPVFRPRAFGRAA